MASLPYEEEDAPPPQIRAAHAILARFRSGEPVDRERLRRLFEAETGRSDAAGAWSMRQAYEALELAQVLYLLDPDCPLLAGTSGEVLKKLQDFAGGLPVQSYRSESQVALQQFSTPLPLAFLAGLAAHSRGTDILLEPSAGNGLLTWPAARAGARLVLNELDPDRRSSLEEAFPSAGISTHDAELIDDVLDPAVHPNLVLMNPPFARSGGRGEDRYAAARHLGTALARLSSGGRLVAIMPQSFCESGSGRVIRAKVERRACLRLDILIAPGAFSKQGTGVAVRLVVYDKAEAQGAPVRGRVDRLDALIARIETLPDRACSPHPEVQLCGSAPALFSRSPARVLPPVPARASRAETAEFRPLVLEVLEQPAPLAEQVGIYLPYRPSRILIPGASCHPTPLVESVAMGSIAAPRPGHVPLLPARLLAEGLLSDAQLETLIYAGSAFGRDLPGRFVPAGEGCDLQPADEDGSAYRCGYFLGDGTGAGKGRQVAGVILDHWLRCNRRHIWLSKNETLLEDARRDWSALGGLPLDIQPLSQWKLGTPIGLDRGILFVTYPALRSGRADATRLQQIVDWAGAAFDGVIAFDEAHAMANAAGGEGSRGKVKGSEQGIAGLRLQNLLPRARVLYASATGASDVNNLAYATRLGLWGPETAFADRNQFVGAIRQGGIAAMASGARPEGAWPLRRSRSVLRRRRI
jgi:protein strawberry notch